MTKLQNGDYLPVSEIKTEQDFNDVVKAAENCGVIVKGWSTHKFGTDDIFDSLWVEHSRLVHGGGNETPNKLTLTQWLERGGIEREQEWMPEVGEECVLVRLGMTIYNDKVEITYIGDGVGCYKDIDSGMEYTYSARDVEFKPLPAPEEVEKQQLLKDAISCCEVVHSGYVLSNDFASKMYNLGYRKTENNND